jgi:hypothetical protein
LCPQCERHEPIRIDFELEVPCPFLGEEIPRVLDVIGAGVDEGRDRAQHGERRIGCDLGRRLGQLAETALCPP